MTEQEATLTGLSMHWFLKKSVYLAAVVLAVSTVTFVCLDVLPLSVVHQIAGNQATSGDIAALRHELHVDDPVLVRYGRWLGAMLHGDFGNSLSFNEPVGRAIASHLPVTLELLLLAEAIALALALPVGIIGAWKEGSVFDRVSGAVAFAVASIPNYSLAVVLVFFLSVRMKWFPSIGFVPLSDGLWQNLRSLLLPAVSIALMESVILMQVLRADMTAVLREDYILLARAKGLPAGTILLRHALRPASFSLITLVGLHVGNLIGGAVIIENMFALPGIGRLLLNAVFSQDYPVVQGCVVVIAVGYVAVNFLTDALYALLDPRVRKRVVDV